MSDNNKNKNFKDTIVIDSSLSDDSVDVITINSSDLSKEASDKNYSYKTSADGNEIKVNLLSNLKEEYLKDKNSKGILLHELFKYGFDEIPASLNITQLKNILEFSMSEIAKNVEQGKIYPFSVEKTENGDLTIILLLYNWNTSPLILGKLPLKLKDANDKVIFADLVDLSKEISPEKIGIYYLKINKDTLKEENMDLTTWTITFEP